MEAIKVRLVVNRSNAYARSSGSLISMVCTLHDNLGALLRATVSSGRLNLGFLPSFPLRLLNEYKYLRLLERFLIFLPTVTLRFFHHFLLVNMTDERQSVFNEQYKIDYFELDEKLLKKY